MTSDQENVNMSNKENFMAIYEFLEYLFIFFNCPIDLRVNIDTLCFNELKVTNYIGNK